MGDDIRYQYEYMYSSKIPKVGDIVGRFNESPVDSTMIVSSICFETIKNNYNDATKDAMYVRCFKYDDVNNITNQNNAYQYCPNDLTLIRRNSDLIQLNMFPEVEVL